METLLVGSIVVVFVLGIVNAIFIFVTRYEIAEMRKRINHNFDLVKRDVTHLDHRTQSLKIHDQKHLHHIWPPPTQGGEYTQ